MASTERLTRPPRRRAETRRRLIEAASEVLETEGITAIAVEGVCARAGYTRGAFHSNFPSMEHLLVEVYRMRTEASYRRLEQIIDSLGEDDVHAPTLDRLVGQILDLLPTDGVIHVLSAVFTSYGTSRPELAREVLEFRSTARAGIEPVLVDLVHRADREFAVEPAVFTRAVLTGYLGGVVDTLLEDPAGSTAALVVTTLVEGLTVERRNV